MLFYLKTQIRHTPFQKFKVKVHRKTILQQDT